MKISTNVAIFLFLTGILNTVWAQNEKPSLGLSGPTGNLNIEKIGDWDVVCENRENGACVMAQIGKDTNGTPVMEMRIRKLPKVQTVEDRKILAIADILTPLAVLLIPGIELQIDLGPVYAAPYQVCIETGCLVREPLAEDTVKAFKAGNKASISMIAAAQQKEVRASISLKGFTKAYEKLN